MTWDGTLGKDSGTLLLGDAASSSIEQSAPALFLDRKYFDGSGGYGVYQTNVSGIELNGEVMPINVTQYVYDTGTPFISLPSAVYDDIYSSNETSTVVFSILTVEGGEAKIEMTITPELLEEGVFQSTFSDTDVHFFGLHIMRYLETVLLNFGSTYPFIKVLPRETFIIDLTTDLKVAEELAGSSTNTTEEPVATESDEDSAAVTEGSFTLFTIVSAVVATVNILFY